MRLCRSWIHSWMFELRINWFDSYSYKKGIMKRDYYNRPKEDSYKTFFWAMIGLIVIIIISIILK
jgi:hypothetical protein